MEVEGRYTDKTPHILVKGVTKPEEVVSGLVKKIGESMCKDLQGRVQKREVRYIGRASEDGRRFSIIKEVLRVDGQNPSVSASVEYGEQSVRINVRDLPGTERDAFLVKYGNLFVAIYGN
jgi:hypothetical protein